MSSLKLAFGGAVALTSLLCAAPAFAFTHHPATPAEIRQTDDLNAQALAYAQAGEAPVNFSDNRSANVDTGAMMKGSEAPPATAPNNATDNDASGNSSTDNNAASPTEQKPVTTPQPSSSPDH